MSTFVSDTVNVMNRELKPVWREPMSVVFAMIQPLVFLGALRAAAARDGIRRLGAPVVRARHRGDDRA